VGKKNKKHLQGLEHTSHLLVKEIFHKNKMQLQEGLAQQMVNMPDDQNEEMYIESKTYEPQK
jgi:hypothetical protein